MGVQLYVFSYNRGAFLRNCVESALRHAPGWAVTVVDDRSSDPETRRVLAELAGRVRIVQPPAGSGASRHGGLYANMQLALERTAPEDWMVAIQDDTQLVRAVEADDMAYIGAYFARFPDAAFLGPRFLMGVRRRGIERAIRLDPRFPVYFYDFSERWKDRSVTMYYMDIFIAHTGRLRSAGWRFDATESGCAQAARRLFGKMGTMAHPFVMNLPAVPFYRGKSKTRAMARAERRMGPEPRRFRDMGAAEVAALKGRDLSRLPFAEDYLHCVPDDLKRPFHYKLINYFPLLRLQHKLELLAARLFRRAGRAGRSR